MNDMTAVIVPKSDQLNSDDLIAGPRTIRIRDVAIRPGTEQPVSIFYDGDNNKPWKPCKSASRVLVAAWGADANAYLGRSATLYRDDGVTWGGMKVGGIRISHLTDIERPLVIALTEKKGSKKIATINPLKLEHRQDAPADALTMDAAIDLIYRASDMPTLERVWKRKDMAPFRDQLRGDLDKAKAAIALPQEGRDDSDQGDAHAAAAHDLATLFDNATTPDDLTAARKAYAVAGASLSDAERAMVDARADAAGERV